MCVQCSLVSALLLIPTVDGYIVFISVSCFLHRKWPRKIPGRFWPGRQFPIVQICKKVMFAGCISRCNTAFCEIFTYNLVHFYFLFNLSLFLSQTGGVWLTGQLENGPDHLIFYEANSSLWKQLSFITTEMREKGFLALTDWYAHLPCPVQLHAVCLVCVYFASWYLDINILNHLTDTKYYLFCLLSFIFSWSLTVLEMLDFYLLCVSGHWQLQVWNQLYVEDDMQIREA